MNEQNMLFQSREGDWSIAVVECGFSPDVDAMIVGWIFATKDGDNKSRATGIIWDESRILVDAAQPLMAREVDALLAAGFMVDEGFFP